MVMKWENEERRDRYSGQTNVGWTIFGILEVGKKNHMKQDVIKNENKENQ